MKNKTSLIIIAIASVVVLLNIMFPTTYGDLVINGIVFSVVLIRVIAEVVSFVVNKKEKDMIGWFNILLYILLLYLLGQRLL